MTRGISDPAPIAEQAEQNLTDLPTMAEVDQALQQAFDEIGALRIEIAVLKDLLGAAIASNARQTPNHLTGL